MSSVTETILLPGTTTLSASKPDVGTPEYHANHSAFTRWRPSFHLMAPHGWLNDPCGPGYDPSTGKYHLAYQWNPNGNDWGNIAWGRATSSDLISWEVDSKPCLSPSMSYDCEGIFTGCFHPTNLYGEQDGTLAYFYTSVSKLPIHYTLPYTRGCETLSIALSYNGGASWERYPDNPILDGPPAEVSVLGWRDPYIFSWPSAPESLTRKLNGSKDDFLYGLVSGGVPGQTPTAFVYAVQRSDMTKWEYMGLLADVGLNLSPSRWSADFGVNWEVINLVTLTDDEGTSRDFLIMGVEGCIPARKTERAVARDTRTQRSQLWMCLKENDRPSSSSSSALMQASFGGVFDAGLFYAANSFWDPIAQQQVLFGWITEEDLDEGMRQEQGWSGLISLPRVLKLQTIHRVKRARSTTVLTDITSLEVVPDSFGSYTVRTLGASVDPRILELRKSAKETELVELDLGLAEEGERGCIALETTRWEVDAAIAVGMGCKKVGFEIHHGSDGHHKTVIFWDPISETIEVDRPAAANSNSTTNHAPEIAPHTLFTCIEKSDGGTEIETEESLQIRAVFDASVLEIFVNERTTISTRIYHDSIPSRLRFFAEPLADGEEDKGSLAILKRAMVWDGLACG